MGLLSLIYGTSNKHLRKSRRPSLREKAANGLRRNLRLEPLEERRLLSAVQWDAVNHPDGGDWDTGSNWVGGQKPGATDAVIIPTLNPDAAVTHASGIDDPVDSITSQAPLAVSAGSLTVTNQSNLYSTLSVSGGTLGGAGELTVNGIFTWHGGGLQGSGGHGSLTANGGAEFLAGPGTLQGGFKLINPAGSTFDYVGGGLIMDANCSFLNHGTLVIADVYYGTLQGQAGSTFCSDGSIIQNVVTNFTIDVDVFDNQGPITVQDSGTLSLKGDSRMTNSGALQDIAGSSLIFLSPLTSTNTSSIHAAGGVTWAQGGTMAGVYQAADTVLQSGALAFTCTVNELGDLSINGALDLTAATLAPGAPNLPSLTLGGGSLITGADFTVSGSFTWHGGGLQGSGGHGSLTANGGAEFLAGPGTLQGGFKLINPAGSTFDYVGGGLIMDANCSFLNHGTLVIADVYYGTLQGQAGSTFCSDGSIIQNVVTNFTIDVDVFDNQGPITVQDSGTLSLKGDSRMTNSGALQDIAGSSLIFLSPLTSTNTSSIHAAGGVTWAQGGTMAGVYQAANTALQSGGLAFTGTVNQLGNLFIVGSMDLTAATLAPDALTIPSLTLSLNTNHDLGALITSADWIVSGMFTWNGGTLEGSGGHGSLTANGGVEYDLHSGNLGELQAGFTFINPAGSTFDFAGGGFNVDNGGSFVNHGLLVIADAVFGYLKGQPGSRFFSDGSIVQNVVTNFTLDADVLDNEGSVDVQSGSLQLEANTLINGGRMQAELNAGLSLIGIGSVVEPIAGLSAGTLYGQIVGTDNISVTGNLQVAMTDGFIPHLVDRFEMIDNLGTQRNTGTFGNLSEGATIWDTTHAFSFTISYVGGDGNDVVLTPNPIPTTTTVATSPNPSIYGQNVTFTVTVAASGSTLTPSGAVQFVIDGVNFGDPVPVSPAGVVTINAPTLAVGAHSVSANYGGNGNVLVASSGGLPGGQVVNSNTTTSVTSSLQPSVYGQSVTFTATVAALVGNATPTGTVQFVIDGSNYGNPVSLSSSGVATIGDAALSTGTHTVVANYSGDGNLLSPSNGALPGGQLVNQDSTTTTAVASANSVAYGQSLNITANVTANPPGAGTPTGTVDFYDVTMSTDLGRATLSSTGTATIVNPFTFKQLLVRSHDIQVAYLGDNNFQFSSIDLTITVNPSIFALDPTAGGALTVSGGAGINPTGNYPGNIVVDSSSATALSASGGATIKANSIQVVGGYSKTGGASISPTPTTHTASVADPLAGLALPIQRRFPSSNGAVVLKGNEPEEISEGVYSQISVSGNASLILDPGLYIITGGGFTVSGHASFSVDNFGFGTAGVMIYNTSSTYNPFTGTDGPGGTFGSISLGGSGTISLVPATGPGFTNTTTPFWGISIYQDRNNTRAISLSGSAVSGIQGAIYAPNSQVVLSSNAQINVTLIVDTLSLSGSSVAQLVASNGGTVYTPAQIRTAYGINNLSLDGTGQTIAIVEAYDDPQIYQALDTFDNQFGLTSSGPTLYQQYGPATSFLTVVNQSGLGTSLPGTDPVGAGNDNWEVETALDVEWVHAIAPAAQIVIVEANSQSLADLMSVAATAAAQPGVSAVSMSWGFAEGQQVLAADEAAYDSTFAVPGVTFVASTGDYGAADPVYPAFSPNVLAVGGTSLSLNSDNSYGSESGWGNYSTAFGAFIGSGGGLSQYETEPAFQQRVQSTGSRTTPDVAFVADPATGAWVADPYNLDPSNPWEVVGGTSLSAPCWAGLVVLVNQGRAAAGKSALDSASSTETQQSLYNLSQNDFHAITTGSNGYSASAGYNLVTGLGTPVADSLVSDLVAGDFPSTGLVAPASAAALVNYATAGSDGSAPANAMSEFNVFTALTGAGNGTARPSSQAASDKVFASYRLKQGISPADVTVSRAAAWLPALESAWNSSDQDKRNESAVAALDTVLARFGL